MNRVLNILCAILDRAGNIPHGWSLKACIPVWIESQIIMKNVSCKWKINFCCLKPQRFGECLFHSTPHLIWWTVLLCSQDKRMECKAYETHGCVHTWSLVETWWKDAFLFPHPISGAVETSLPTSDDNRNQYFKPELFLYFIYKTYGA